MKRYKIFLLFIVAGTLIQACSKYTDIKTEGALTPSDYVNYRYLMNNRQDLERSVDMPDMTADDIVYNDAAIQQGLSAESRNAYMWAAQYYDVVAADPDWKILYANIYPCNLVIRDVMNSNGGTTQLKKQVLAEARVHRAYSYFTLVNMYGKQYNESSKATDLGVPLLLEPDVAIVATRATVQQAYDQILTDLQAAVPDLPEKNTYNIYPSKAAAYALLARAYLQMGQYAEAEKNADNALMIQSGLLDLPTLSSYPQRTDNPEIILSKTAGMSHQYSAMQVMSSQLLSLYDTKDYRYSYFTSNYTLSGNTYRVYSKEAVIGGNRNIGPSVPEMLLIKAECRARAGDAGGAMSAINTLRAKRFAALDFTPMTATSAADALVKVLQERRRELCFTCIRWFDQKRLFTDSRFAENITRTNFATGETYTLTPGSNRYLFPIPQYNIQLNPSLEQNQR
ncbi:RagB/SusD family nutrient uptake outer membrane protein [Chitinophaga sp. CC14]|uniref:RagB/SusD family nutrient uptake outer membrane protein n=1 Tax=Chitinophaga sp. CC14 TaxID=3029199 RepID=UPI003B822509